MTPKTAEAVTSSPAPKILFLLSQENVEIVGIQKEPLPYLVEEVVEIIKEDIRDV